MPPDASLLRGALARVSRRLVLVSGAFGGAAGLGVALIALVAGWPSRDNVAGEITVALVCAAVGAGVAILARRAPPALLVERRTPQSRNVVLTATELLDRRDTGYVATLVYRDAARVLGALDLSALIPARGAVTALIAVSALWLLGAARVELPAVRGGAASHGPSSPTAAAVRSADITIQPPAYVGGAARTVHDPSRIEALAGSKLHVVVYADAATVGVETLDGRANAPRAADGSFSADLTATTDGYLAIAPVAATGAAGVRRLIGLTVTPDAPPRVRITAPARDLFLRDSAHVIELALDASDDIGIARLELHYTRVSGSGERFTFTDGTVPLTVSRRDARTWSARATWPLAQLGLTAGDMVVYRAEAADARPGAVPSQSDSYIAEIVQPGGQAGPGFEIDPEQERYAVSQQMVILKTERLLARRPSMPADEYANAAQEIAAEQRKVRAEFVFMMGGELEDAPDPNGSITDINEEAEARGEADILAGRMANRGRIALMNATRYMSRASTSLTTADLTAALPLERSALAQLEQAFSRTRMLLRALSRREALDLSRRLTGALGDATGDARPAADPASDPRLNALRRVLAAIAGVSSAGDAGALAVRVLQADPSSKELQGVSASLNAAAADFGRGRERDARDRLNRAATDLAAALRSDVRAAPQAAPTPATRALSGALADALRNARGTP